MNIPHLFEAKNIMAGYEKKIIIEDINLTIPSNCISVIIGANACGKSTLLKTLARLIQPYSGDILLDYKKIHEYVPKQLAKILGLLPQSPIVPEGITVGDLVSRGRFPYQSFFTGLTKKDLMAIEEAMEIMGISHLANQCVDELSGGQRQRVWISMALAQQTDILLLDEPTTFLDISYQIEILDLLAELNRKRGTTIVMVLHDINLSARYADRIFALHKGKLIAEGSPSEILTEDLIRQVFNLESIIIKDPLYGSPMVIPKGRQILSICAEEEWV